MHIKSAVTKQLLYSFLFIFCVVYRVFMVLSLFVVGQLYIDKLIPFIYLHYKCLSFEEKLVVEILLPSTQTTLLFFHPFS